ncbi:hypothetical protein S7711_06485 [Stachybotrys chartarum IBT 7711]|uniref:Polynucleotide 5'-hydroxyl-kinase GRC3 n=1 Tax=Stachybotrys chartarum (strain CBS 109288 / IBT 7711) TaxID=1280523 RepID=A0A084AXC4_STACB|nr:hypothetical protein S7711_06485 [Stachybotrys chartarum IBT 7711]
MMGNKEIPHRDTLRDYGHAVAGHAGTMTSANGELFIKPCTQSEIDFYHSANRRHPEFSDLMPLFMGSLKLSDPDSLDIEAEVAGVISDAGEIQATRDQIRATIAAEAARAVPEPESSVPAWAPKAKSKKIKTDQAIVLENASGVFKQPNILDCKLGVRLWADDAPAEKKQRFDKISAATTHAKLGFRIAGMRVFRGSENPAELDGDQYRVYDKDYGRTTVNNDNVVDEFRRFVFNTAAGVDEDLGRAVCAAFVRDLKHVQDVLERHESRMYSASLLFVFEGDGEALREAIEENNELVERPRVRDRDTSTKRVDSGIVMEEEDDEDEYEDEESSLPAIYSLKLIDFAHATWTPGQGPDENVLKGRQHVYSGPGPSNRTSKTFNSPSATPTHVPTDRPAAQPVVTTSTRTVRLNPAWEWRFEAPIGSNVVVKLLSGTAEKDGVELAPRSAYTFSNIKSRILTWQGCELEVDGRCDDEFVAEYANPAANPAVSYLNLHAALREMRIAAAREGREGPRVLVAGPPVTGKTTLAKTLTSYAVKQGHQPLVVNADPREGMLSFAGTLSAAVFATIIDPETATGWGSTPASAPSAVPVKLPLVHYYGRQSAEEEPDFYRELVGRMAGTVSGRLSEDESVKSSGVIVDSMGISEKSKIGLDLLAHIVDELSINIIVVLGSTRMNAELMKRFAEEKTSLGEPITVVLLDKSEGVVERDEAFEQHSRDAAIKEYFFGDARMTLSPQIQQVDFDSLVIYKPSDYSTYGEDTLIREEPSALMQHWALAIMHAGLKDPPETVRAASVMGFVHVADVDEERRKVKILAPGIDYHARA